MSYLSKLLHITYIMLVIYSSYNQQQIKCYVFFSIIAHPSRIFNFLPTTDTRQIRPNTKGIQNAKVRGVECGDRPAV